jgi:hypothetical protein
MSGTSIETLHRVVPDQLKEDLGILCLPDPPLRPAGLEHLQDLGLLVPLERFEPDAKLRQACFLDALQTLAVYLLEALVGADQLLVDEVWHAGVSGSGILVGGYDLLADGVHRVGFLVGEETPAASRLVAGGKNREAARHYGDIPDELTSGVSGFAQSSPPVLLASASAPSSHTRD